MNTRLLALVALAGVGTGWLLQVGSADAEVRRLNDPQGFTSGAMRSEQVLEEIKAIMLRMEGSLARMERAVVGLRQDIARQPDTSRVIPGGIPHVR
ncbi:hypothetical protein [Botrimarina hoheduenensis]|uniref:Uncharacterized protein n=1 Tax=Botrimarina hoheduenensis TaxID=2528000 RepID=A0A5C5VNI9_9BACT|nr:hypothetical protein [Botrimarina hoheduenensis]TWT40148.1 hypothetical protein Pla111_34120 [Botrimarina hoheduenensis]